MLCWRKRLIYLYVIALRDALIQLKLHCPGITSEDVRKSDLLAELTNVMSDGVSQDLWILSIGIDNNPWGQYQPLIPWHTKTRWMNTDGTGFNTCKECHKTESLWNHTTTDHKEEQLEDWRNGESNCNFGDGMDQRVQSLMFMMMMMIKVNKENR